MSSQRVKLSKKLFMGLKPGQYIMNNTLPMIYEEITTDIDSQWNKWRRENSRIVDIFDSLDECLKKWWSINSEFRERSKNQVGHKSLLHERLSKKIFFAQPDGYYILFLQDPFDYFELREDRASQWDECKEKCGRNVMIFKNHVDCIMELLTIVDSVFGR